MAYQANEAVRLDGIERGRELPQQRPFEVVEGAGLDAKVRRGVSPRFISRAKKVMSVFLIVMAIGSIRVGISAATVTTLKASSEVRVQLAEATELADELKVEKSILSSGSRITRIATQNYGMVYAGPGENMDIGDSAASDEQSAAVDGDTAQQADEANAVGAES